jgi:hypothetical protein
VKHFTESIHKAAQDAALHMTADLRSSAEDHGWDSDVVKNMHVSYTDGKFSLNIHPDYQSRAFVHEYGNETVRPTAVLRKYEHQMGDVSKFFNKRFVKHLGVK